MKALVVYESLWGNTARVARAVAEGIGGGTQAVSTAQATVIALEDVDLLVAGAPVIAFNLTNEKTRPKPESLPPGAPTPDLSHPMMRTWLESLPRGKGRGAAFETRVRGPFGHAHRTITEGLASAGYADMGMPGSFIVAGRYGRLKDGEIERAREWGAELARKMG